MELIDKQALREKLKDKLCIFPAAIRRAIDEAPVVHEVTNRDREALQEHIMSLIPETIDTDAGTHIYLLYQEHLKIAKVVTDGLVRPLESLENRILVLEHDKKMRDIRDKVTSLFATMQYGTLGTSPERTAHYKQKLNEIFGSGTYQDTDSVRGENE